MGGLANGCQEGVASEGLREGEAGFGLYSFGELQYITIDAAEILFSSSLET